MNEFKKTIQLLHILQNKTSVERELMNEFYLLNFLHFINVDQLWTMSLPHLMGKCTIVVIGHCHWGSSSSSGTQYLLSPVCVTLLVTTKGSSVQWQSEQVYVRIVWMKLNKKKKRKNCREKQLEKLLLLNNKSPYNVGNIILFKWRNTSHIKDDSGDGTV